MGWCQAFGPQIRAGCDHAMVANTASCSCPECRVVCTGKFSGCAAVWVAGPQPVAIRRPTKAIGRSNGQLALAAGANGRKVPSPAGDGPRLEESSSGLDSYADLRPLLNALRAEVQVLSRKVDQIQPSGSDGQAAQRVMAVVEGLPDNVARVAMQAMRAQHETSIRDLRDLWQRLEQSAQDSQPLADPDKPVTLRQMDARFSWMVDELSERLVTLGNEIARLDKELAAGSSGGRTRNGHSDKAQLRGQGDSRP